MITTIQGLPFDTITPSHFCLVLPDRAEALEVFYAGDTWLLFMQDAQGGVKVAPYPSRDAAIALIAEAFRMEGL